MESRPKSAVVYDADLKLSTVQFRHISRVRFPFSVILLRLFNSLCAVGVGAKSV